MYLLFSSCTDRAQQLSLHQNTSHAFPYAVHTELHRHIRTYTRVLSRLTHPLLAAMHFNLLDGRAAVAQDLSQAPKTLAQTAQAGHRSAAHTGEWGHNRATHLRTAIIHVSASQHCNIVVMRVSSCESPEQEACAQHQGTEHNIFAHTAAILLYQVFRAKLCPRSSAAEYSCNSSFLVTLDRLHTI